MTGAPPDFCSEVTLAGPLATFDGADNWVDHPYRDGIALIGDAAATSDPNWGQGMSLALRDARVLTDFLRADDDWDAAAHAYAGEHGRYYSVIHSVEDWTTQVFLKRGPQADEIRIRAKLAMDRHVCRTISLQVRTSRSTLRPGRGCLATTRSADCS